MNKYDGDEKVEKVTYKVNWWEHYISQGVKNPFLEERTSDRIREEVKKIREYIMVSLKIPRT